MSNETQKKPMNEYRNNFLLRTPYIPMAIGALGFLLILIADFGWEYISFRKTITKQPLEKELTATIHALQENSQQASALVTQLQSEITKRAKVMQETEGKLEELRQQRALLDLTPEQQKGLQILLRRAPSATEILTSLDFWLGKVLVSIIISAVFFIAGILYQRTRARKAS